MLVCTLLSYTPAVLENAEERGDTVRFTCHPKKTLMIGYGVHHPNQALRTLSLDLRESVRCAHFRGPAEAL